MVAAVHSDGIYVRPPEYVLRERNIRLTLRHSNASARLCGEPLPGYSAKDAKDRNLSVQDALEICALNNGDPSDVRNLALAYGVSVSAIKNVLSGVWFDSLLPRKKHQAPPIAPDLPDDFTVYRVPVLTTNGSQNARIRERRSYDPVTGTWSHNHLYRASVTLARVA